MERKARETIAVVKKAVVDTAAGIGGLVESQLISDTIFAMDNKSNTDFFVLQDNGVRRNTKELK